MVIVPTYVLLCQNAKKVDLEKTAVRPVSVRMRAVVTTSLGDAAAQMVGLEPTANCVSISPLQ